MLFTRPKKLCLGLILVSLSACSIGKKDALELSAKNYVRALKAKDEGVLVALVDPEKQEMFFGNLAAIHSLELYHAEVQSIFPDEKFNEAIVTIGMEYFPVSGASAVVTSRMYAFKFDQKRKGWFVSETSPFGRARTRTMQVPGKPTQEVGQAPAK